MCLEAIWRVWGDYLVGVGRLFGGHREAIRRALGAALREWGGYLEDVGKLSGVCRMAVFGMRRGYLGLVG